MDNILYKDEAYAIVGAAIEVHRELGPGFLEAVYQEALEKEFIYRGLPHVREQKLLIHYKGEPLSKYYVADFVCYDKIIVELKATQQITPDNESQMLNYLTATKMRLGLLINFGCKSLEYRRLIH